MAITSQVGINTFKSFLVSFLVSGIENIVDRNQYAFLRLLLSFSSFFAPYNCGKKLNPVPSAVTISLFYDNISTYHSDRP